MNKLIAFLLFVCVPAFGQTNWVWRGDTSTNEPYSNSDGSSWYWTDADGNTITQAVTGAGYVSEGGYGFDGNDKVDLVIPLLQIALTNATTVWMSAWVQPSNTINNLDGLLELTAGAAGAGFNLKWDTTGHDGLIHGVRSQPGDAYTFHEDEAHTWTNNAWAYCVWEWALEREYQLMWYNGALLESNATALASTQWKMTDFSVAMLGLQATAYWNGRIDDVKFGTNILDATSVSAAYSLGRNGVPVAPDPPPPGQTVGLSVLRY